MAAQVTGCLRLLIWLLLLQPQLGTGPGDRATQSSPRGFSDKPNDKSTRPQEAHVNIVESGSCRKIPKKELKMVNNSDRKGGLCASAEGKDSCQGDSWSPLFCDINKRWVQVAVVSWGIGCGHRNPGVYTDVTFYQRWIVREVSRSTRLDTEDHLVPHLCLLLLLASW